METPTKQTKALILETFILGVKGIVRISGVIREPFKAKSYLVCAILASIFILLIFILGISSFDTINELVSIATNLLPGILGFSIGGYSFLVGFIQSGLMNRISEPQEGSKFSLYQEASASFAVNILLQALTLGLAYIFHFITYISQRSSTKLGRIADYSSFINCFGLILIAFALSTSFASIIQLIANVFNFSQLYHYDVNKAKVDRKEVEELEESEAHV